MPGSGDHDTRTMTAEDAVALLQESWEDDYLSVEEKEAVDALAARVAELGREAERARDQETMWRERWEERHARVAALEHALRLIASCEVLMQGDVVSIARDALTKADNQ